MKLGLMILLAGWVSRAHIYAQELRAGFPINTTIEFTGTVGDRPVRVELTHSEVGLNGRYKVLENGKIISLEGVIDPQHAYAIELEEGPQEEDHPRPLWRAVYRHDSIVGKRRGIDKKEYSVRLGRRKAKKSLLSFRSIQEDTVVYSLPKDTNSTKFTYVYDYLQARGSSVLASWMNKELKESLMPVDDKEKQVKNYQESLEEIGHAEYASWNWDYEQEIQEYYQDNGYLVLESNGYQYYGGAHGLSWNLFTSYDLRNKKKLELSDIVKIDSTQFKTLLERQFRKNYQVEEEQHLKDFGLFENEIAPNTNFSFNDWGLTFTYNQYEIGPYVLGIMEVFIPWEELAPYLRSDFARRMALKQ